MPHQRDSILFLCVANSARSQMAEALGRAMAPSGVTVFSAGSAPTEMNPLAVRVLEELGLDVSEQTSKGLDDIPQERVRIVVTLCAEEVCPALLGSESHGEVVRLHWPQEDPAAAEGDEEAVLAVFRRVRDQIGAQLAKLLEDEELFSP